MGMEAQSQEDGSPEPREAFSNISSWFPLDGGSIYLHPKPVVTTDKPADCTECSQAARAP